MRVLWYVCIAIMVIVGVGLMRSGDMFDIFYQEPDLVAKHTIDCQPHVVDDGVMIDGPCLWFPPVYAGSSFTQSVDLVWDDIVGFSDEYKLYSGNFVYDGATPLFTGDMHSFISVFSSPLRSWGDALLSQTGSMVLSDREYAAWRLMGYSYHVVRREKLDELGPCSRINYNVAMIAIDGKYVLPGDEFNVNKRVAYRIGYCGSADDYDTFAFQSGVCGASSQVFRTALIHPDLEVVERHPHRIWYERYYDTTIWGDDAAIIEWRKQLRIINTGSYPLYFRTKAYDSSALLVVISPYLDDRWVRIQREQLTDLSGRVTTTTYDKGGDILYQTGWVSEYVMRESGIVN